MTDETLSAEDRIIKALEQMNERLEAIAAKLESKPEEPSPDPIAFGWGRIHEAPVSGPKSKETRSLIIGFVGAEKVSPDTETEQLRK